MALPCCWWRFWTSLVISLRLSSPIVKWNNSNRPVASNSPDPFLDFRILGLFRDLARKGWHAQMGNWGLQEINKKWGSTTEIDNSGRTVNTSGRKGQEKEWLQNPERSVARAGAWEKKLWYKLWHPLPRQGFIARELGEVNTPVSLLSHPLTPAHACYWPGSLVVAIHRHQPPGAQARWSEARNESAALYKTPSWQHMFNPLDSLGGGY